MKYFKEFIQISEGRMTLQKLTTSLKETKYNLLWNSNAKLQAFLLDTSKNAQQKYLKKNQERVLIIKVR